MSIDIYTDGACSNNQLSEDKRKAGIGVLFDDVQISERVPEQYRPYTNNRAEMWACIRALQLTEQYRDKKCRIHSDSNIVVMTMTGKYKKKANLDLWMMLDELSAGRDIEWIKVKGHSGVPQNEIVDRLAVAAIK